MSGINSTTVIQSIMFGLAYGGIFVLISSGLTLIYAVTRHFNFAHGHFLIVGMYLSLAFYNTFELDPYLSFFIVAPLMLILGLLVFRFLLKPLIYNSPITSLIMFFGVALIIQNLLPILFDDENHAIPTFLDLSKLHFGPYIIKTALLVALIVSLIVSLGFYWLLKRTDFGRAIRAIAQKPDSAALMGINVRRVQMLVFALGFVLLAIAGTAYIPMTSFSPTKGLQITLFAFIIIALGGMGDFVGALVAGMIIGLAQAMSSLLWGSAYSSTIPYVLFILVMLFKPHGLFGGKIK